MKTLKILFSTLLMFVLTSCTKNEITVQVYPDKLVTFKTSRVLTSIAQPFSKAALSMDINPTPAIFPEYDHEIPTKFTVYFVATTGNDQGTVIKKIENLSEGNHQITIPARAYKVIATNYTDIEGKSELKRNWLPEKSEQLYLYGVSNIDYSQVDEGEVKITNDYAAAMVLKNDVVKSVPQITGTSFFDTNDYYILYVRDQNGASGFTRDISLKISKKDGGVENYNFNQTFDANKVYRFLLQKYSNLDGNLNLIVDENILKDIKDKIIIPNK